MGQIPNRIAAITDDTHATLAGSFDPSLYTLTGVTLNALPSNYDFWGGIDANTNWNFYDDVLGLYRLYYETGIDDYLNQARTIADLWYTYALSAGYNIQYPRNTAMQGLMLRAEDGHPEYWNGIMRYMNYSWGTWGYSTQFTLTFSTASTNFDARENGYMLRWGALISKLHPDAATRSAWCGYVAHSVTQTWALIQDDLGNFEEEYV